MLKGQKMESQSFPADEQVTSVVVTPDLAAEEEDSSSGEKMTVPEEGQRSRSTEADIKKEP